MRQLYLIIYIILFTFIVSCSNSRTVTITDFSRSQEFNFTTPTETLFHIGENVEAIFMDVKGQIDGNVRISGSCGGDVTGKVDTIFRCDWYSDEGTLLVIPLGQQVKGKLKISFRFSKI